MNGAVWEAIVRAVRAGVGGAVVLDSGAEVYAATWVGDERVMAGSGVLLGRTSEGGEVTLRCTSVVGFLADPIPVEVPG